jgi:hypothetical protein
MCNNDTPRDGRELDARGIVGDFEYGPWLCPALLHEIVRTYEGEAWA